MAYNPKVLLPYMSVGKDAVVLVTDMATWAQKGEKLSWYQLQVSGTCKPFSPDSFGPI